MSLELVYREVLNIIENSLSFYVPDVLEIKEEKIPSDAFLVGWLYYNKWIYTSSLMKFITTHNSSYIDTKIHYDEETNIASKIHINFGKDNITMEKKDFPELVLLNMVCLTIIDTAKKTDYLYVNMAFYPRLIDPHGNLMVIQKCRDKYYVGVYEPHGYKSIDPIHKYIQGFLEKRLNVEHVDPRLTCPIGLQGYIYKDVGFCDIHSLYWIYCFSKITSKIDKNIPMSDWTRYIEITTQKIIQNKIGYNRDGEVNLKYVPAYRKKIKELIKKFGFMIGNLMLTDAKSGKKGSLDSDLSMYILDVFKTENKKGCIGDTECDTGYCVNNRCCTEKDLKTPNTICSGYRYKIMEKKRGGKFLKRN
jgi:hypothetical protein